MKNVPDTSDGRHDLKQQLRQMESIAALSGGIAHDYNNLLTAIMGNISLAMDRVGKDAAISNLLEQALEASRVAKHLTRTLITFSKGGLPSRQPIDIVQVVEDVAAFSLSGSNIICEVIPLSEIWPAYADSQQVGQAIHNLIINAAESMPSGGTITIRFENTTVDSPNTSLPSGRYVHVSITDNGIGIPPENINRIFDPYFSTKSKGIERGTGLGLSISHSIIAKHGGKITVSSRVGVGSTFNVLLPATENIAYDEPADSMTRPPVQADKIVTGRGRVLVMDDEAMIRELTGNMLQHLGYEVDFAEEGRTVLEKYQAAMDASEPYDAVILDLTIKGGMGGQETIQLLKKLDPEVKAIVSSGYSENPAVANYRDYGFCEAVAKPYEMIEFSQTLYRVVSGT